MKITLKLLLTNGTHFSLLAALFLVHSNSQAKSYDFIQWQLPSKRFADLGVDAKKIAQISDGGQFLVVSNPQNFSFWNARKKQLQEFKNKRVIYAATVIDAPADEVREMVWDLQSQGDFSPLLEDTTNLRTEGNVRIASYEQIIKVPILKLASDFVVQLNRYDNGDIGMVLIDKGDIEATFQYWEFFPLDDHRTLTVLSGWQDTDSASLMYKIILQAEPSIGRVFPILSIYERLAQFKQEAARRHPDIAEKADETLYDFRNINRFISENNGVDLQQLKKLTQLGGLHFYQKVRKLSHNGKVHDVYQVSAIEYIPLPQKAIQPLLNDFSSLAEYNALTEEWLAPNLTGEDWGHLRIAVDIGPIHVPVEIYVVTEDISPDRMLFHSVAPSYMHPILGHVEYMQMDDPNDQGTIVEVTIGGVIGPDASFVFKMARYLPFHNVFIAATYAMLTADSAGDWVINRVAEDQQRLEIEKSLGQL